MSLFAILVSSFAAVAVADSNVTTLPLLASVAALVPGFKAVRHQAVSSHKGHQPAVKGHRAGHSISQAASALTPDPSWRSPAIESNAGWNPNVSPADNDTVWNPDPSSADNATMKELQETMKELAKVANLSSSMSTLNRIGGKIFELRLNQFVRDPMRAQIIESLVEPLTASKRFFGSEKPTDILESSMEWAGQFVNDVSMKVTGLEVKGDERKIISGTLETKVHAKFHYPPVFQLASGEASFNKEFIIKAPFRSCREDGQLTQADFFVTQILEKDPEHQDLKTVFHDDLFNVHRPQAPPGLQWYGLRIAWGALIAYAMGDPTVLLPAVVHATSLHMSQSTKTRKPHRRNH